MEKAIVVGIAGGSASGKTTFSNLLKENLSDFKVKVFHIDDYFKPEELRPYSEAPITGVMYVDNNHPESVNLPQIRMDLEAELIKNMYDIIIVEGFLTLYDKEIYKHLNLKLFIECRPDERIVRRLKRGMERGKEFNQVAKIYLDLVRYRHDEYVEPSKWKADLILNGSSSSEQGLKILTDYIKISVMQWNKVYE